MIRTEEKEMKEDGLDRMAEATTVDLQRPKAAETARGIVEKKEFRWWRESRGSGQESSLQQRRSLRWSRSEGCVGLAGVLRKTDDGRDFS